MADVITDTYYADPASPGRVVQIKSVNADGVATIETVQAADAAVSSNAVGKVTQVTRKTLRRFEYLGDDMCTWCGYNQTHKAGGGYHCPVVD